MVVYDREEIQSKVDELTSKISQLERNRTDINKQLAQLRVQRDCWEELSVNQTKLFPE